MINKAPVADMSATGALLPLKIKGFLSKIKGFPLEIKGFLFKMKPARPQLVFFLSWKDAEAKAVTCYGVLLSSFGDALAC